MKPAQERSTPDSATSDIAGDARPWLPVLCDATATGAVAVVIGIVIGQLADIATADILTRPTFLVNASIAVAIAVLSAWPPRSAKRNSGIERAQCEAPTPRKMTCDPEND